MAIFWTPKAPGDVYRYTWQPPLVEGDSLSSYTISASGATIDSDAQTGDEVVAYVSGGTGGTTAIFTLTGTSAQGESFDETIYLPIVASPSQIADTARNYAMFALRKATGIGETPDADELSDALERMNALVAEWRAGGADIGAPFPLTADSVIYCPDWAVSALRYNLMRECADIYGFSLGPNEIAAAMRGLQLVKHKGLPVEREGAEYF